MPESQPMQAYKMLITIPESRRLEIALPADAPSGPAEVIVLIPRADPPGVISWPFLRRRSEDVSGAAQPAKEGELHHPKQRAI